jgi:hypothetical protein
MYNTNMEKAVSNLHLVSLPWALLSHPKFSIVL